MPGAMLPPLNLDFLSDIGKNIGAGFRQFSRPVYNAAGVQVGSYENLDALCQGVWFPFVDVPTPPTSQLYVIDAWNRRVPLATRCVQSAKATQSGNIIDRFLNPANVQPASAAVAVASSNAAQTGDPRAVDLAAVEGSIAVTRGELSKLGTYALWGGGALLAGALLFGGTRRRGR